MLHQLPNPRMALLALVGLGITAVATIATAAPLTSTPAVTSRTNPGRPWTCPHGSMGMMQSMQATNELEFFSLMIPHHQEAIATAKLVLERSDRPEMQEFARTIIKVQSAEMRQMQDWLGQWYPGQKTTLTYEPMMRDLSQLHGSDLDQIFLEDMIRHHMEAVMMAQRLVNHNLVQHSPVRPFAQNIANTQRAEIWQMRTWLADWYGVATAPMGGSGSWNRGPGGPGWGGRMNRGW